ncbi:hypothetical protein HK098_007566, partial [Nowakowskiella sp. JEL0407]
WYRSLNRIDPTIVFIDLALEIDWSGKPMNVCITEYFAANKELRFPLKNSSFPLPIMSESVCFALIEKHFRARLGYPHNTNDEDVNFEIVSLSLVSCMINSWSIPISLYLSLRQNSGSNFSEDNKIIKLLLLNTLIYDVVAFIQPLYRYIPDHMFDHNMARLFTLWTAENSPQNLTDLPRTFESDCFGVYECLYVLSTLILSGKLEFAGDFLDQIERTQWKDVSRIRNTEIYCQAVEVKNFPLLKYVYERNPNLSTNPDINTALTNAARLNPDETAMQILRFVYDHLPKGIDLHVFGDNALIAAIFSHNVDAFKFLISKGMNRSHDPSNHEQTPLHLAAMCSQTQMVELILNDSTGDIFLMDEDGLSPAHQAARSGCIDILEMLFDAAPDVIHVKSAGSEEITPMDCAIAANRLETVKYLQQKGARISVLKLHSAVSQGNIEMCKYVISNAPEIKDFSFPEKQNPLLNAAINGVVEIGKMLLDAGMEIDLCDNRGWTSLHFAADNGRLEFVEFLLDQGSQALNAITKSHHTPVNLASYQGFSEVMRCLIERGADIEIEDTDGDTALTNSVMFNDGIASIEILELLLDHGANINHVSKSGDNVLHKCCENGMYRVVKFLIEKIGTERLMKLLSQENKLCYTPFDVAESKSWEDAAILGRLIGHLSAVV